MLRVINDNKLGSHPIMVKPAGQYVNLDFPASTKRKFPKENPTETPKFNSCKVKLYSNKNLTPNIANGYSNNYHKSTTRMEPSVHESAVNNMFRPLPYQQTR